VAGLAPVKRNRFIALEGAVKGVNRELEAKARTLGRDQGLRHQPFLAVSFSAVSYLASRSVLANYQKSDSILLKLHR
jgi:hypothetical protein